jgi:hypothetical protein
MNRCATINSVGRMRKRRRLSVRRAEDEEGAIAFRRARGRGAVTRCVRANAFGLRLRPREQIEHFSSDR